MEEKNEERTNFHETELCTDAIDRFESVCLACRDNGYGVMWLLPQFNCTYMLNPKIHRSHTLSQKTETMKFCMRKTMKFCMRKIELKSFQERFLDLILDSGLGLDADKH